MRAKRAVRREDTSPVSYDDSDKSRYRLMKRLKRRVKRAVGRRWSDNRKKAHRVSINERCEKSQDRA